jgi:ABC-type lipoprotein export system ATPase subunit
MTLVELTNYSFESRKTGQPFRSFDFSLTNGDVVSISTDSAEDALSFLKVLATLIPPLKGEYRYMQALLDFSNHRKLLEIKKNIGFITSHTALISNRSVRENLLLQRAYYTNSLSNKLDPHAQALCDLFAIENKLELRPAELTEHDYRCAVTVRELTKSPAVLLMEYPEKYIGIANLEAFNDILFDMLGGELGIVFLSEYKNFIETFSKKELVISKGTMQIT